MVDGRHNAWRNRAPGPHAQTHSEAGYGWPVDKGVWTANTVKRPRQQPAHPQYANYWAPLTRKWHTLPHSAQPQHTNYWAPRTRKRHQQEHRPQRPTERSDPTQHAKGRTGDCPGPRKETTTRRNVTQGGGVPSRAGTSRARARARGVVIRAWSTFGLRAERQKQGGCWESSGSRTRTPPPSAAAHTTEPRWTGPLGPVFLPAASLALVAQTCLSPRRTDKAECARLSPPTADGYPPTADGYRPTADGCPPNRRRLPPQPPCVASSLRTHDLFSPVHSPWGAASSRPSLYMLQSACFAPRRHCATHLLPRRFWFFVFASFAHFVSCQHHSHSHCSSNVTAPQNYCSLFAVCHGRRYWGISVPHRYRRRVSDWEGAQGGGGGGRDALEGGEVPPSRAPGLCPATVPLTPSASLNGICNRQ